MSNLFEIDDQNFASEVLNSDLPVLVDFSATWCGPCKRQLPIVEQFAAANSGKIKVCKVDVDEALEVAEKLKIKSVPSLALFNHGQRIDTKVGLMSIVQLNNWVLEKIGA